MVFGSYEEDTGVVRVLNDFVDASRGETVHERGPGGAEIRSPEQVGCEVPVPVAVKSSQGTTWRNGARCDSANEAALRSDPKG